MGWLVRCSSGAVHHLACFAKKVASLISALSRLAAQQLSHASFFARMVKVIKRLRPGSPSKYQAFHPTKRDVITHFLLQDPRAPLVKAVQQLADEKVKTLELENAALKLKMEALEATMDADNKEFRAALRALQAKSTSA